MLRRYCYLPISWGYYLLCVRQVVASTYDTENVLAIVVLFAASFILGLLRPRSGLLACVIAVPLLNGLAQSVLLATPAPVTYVFSSFSLGLVVRKYMIRSPVLAPACRSKLPERVLLATNVMSGAILLSLAFQFWFSRISPTSWVTILGRPSFAYGDTNYFITASLVWLQGIFIFKQAVELRTPTMAQTREIAWIFLTVSLLFVLFQYVFRVPTPYNHQKMGNHFAYYMPFDDISSFGSIGVSLLVYFFVSATQQRLRWTLVIATTVAAGLVVNSWSRATWLSGIMILLVFIGVRLKKKHALILSLFILASVVFLNWLPNTRFVSGPYLGRAVSLVRFESLETKLAGRVSLYQKGLRMVVEQPIWGNGIGSFYLKSTRYADSKERSSGLNLPDFAHNAFLQLATELGLPIAIVFGSIVIAALAAPAVLCKKASNTFSVLILCTASPISMALAVYVLTQLTANSLNIYPSNQFYFWVLAAAALRGRSVGALNGTA